MFENGGKTILLKIKSSDKNIKCIYQQSNLDLMCKIITTMIVFPVIFQAYSQKMRKISTNIDFHINNTLYDRTISNNSVGFGLAWQTFINTKTKFTPAIEIASEVYGGTKQFFMTADGKPIYAKSSVTTIFAGAMYKVSSKFYFGGMLGAGFFNSETYFAIKPFMGYQLFNKWMIAKIAWANIFQRDDISNQSFGYLSLGAGIKLF